jgi:hypothetical protein
VEGTVNETTISSDTSPKLAKVMELARKDPGLRLRSLAHVLDEDLLTRSFHQLRKDAAIGVSPSAFPGTRSTGITGNQGPAR